MIIQICSGSISLIASLLIVVFIALMKHGLSNPYRRIIFGLSISDIFQSFGIVAGPFLNRTDTPQAIWAIGNERSCEFCGFLYMAGSTAVPMYTLCLCIYYVCKLKGKMTDGEFSRRVETKMHTSIILFNLGLYLTALGMDTINSGTFGNLCLVTATPTGCRQNPEVFGECDPATARISKNILLVPHVWMPMVSIIGIIVCLAVIFWNVVVSERIFGHPSEISRGTDQTQSDQTNQEGETANGVLSLNARNDSRAILRLYKRELVIQAFCYVLVFLLSMMPYLTLSLILLDGSHPSRNHYRIGAIMNPLGGFFNIIVFSRMNVESFHRRHPECSRIKAFWLVIKAGGGMPNDRNWNQSNNRTRRRSRPREFPSSLRNTAQGVREGVAGFISDDLEGFSNFKGPSISGVNDSDDLKNDCTRKSKIDSLQSPESVGVSSSDMRGFRVISGGDADGVNNIVGFSGGSGMDFSDDLDGFSMIENSQIKSTGITTNDQLEGIFDIEESPESSGVELASTSENPKDLSNISTTTNPHEKE